MFCAYSVSSWEYSEMISSVNTLGTSLTLCLNKANLLTDCLRTISNRFSSSFKNLRSFCGVGHILKWILTNKNKASHENLYCQPLTFSTRKALPVGEILFVQLSSKWCQNTVQNNCLPLKISPNVSKYLLLWQLKGWRFSVHVSLTGVAVTIVNLCSHVLNLSCSNWLNLFRVLFCQGCLVFSSVGFALCSDLSNLSCLLICCFFFLCSHLLNLFCVLIC